MALLLEARGLGKCYADAQSGRVKGLMQALAGRTPALDQIVLENIDLRICRGESIALIGQNGAGKSTLLKLISGVLKPTSGELIVHTTIGSLLELGAGFNEELSGWENLHQSSSLINIPVDQREVAIQQAAEFSELGIKLEQPIKTYSSGMVVRLGFGLMTALNPGLLITDEVLAVGDESFQSKCTQWIESYLDQGGTLLLVSHSPYQVQKLCQKAIWLKDGRIESEGDAFEVTQAYTSYLDIQSRDEDQGEQLLCLSEVKYQEDHQQLTFSLSSSSEEAVVAGVCLQAQDGSILSTDEVLVEKPDVTLKWSLAGLLPGLYFVSVLVKQDKVLPAMTRSFRVTGKSREMGLLTLERQWLS